MTLPFRIAFAVLSLTTAAAPASAQFARSEGGQFLEAIRDPEKANEVIRMLNKTGTTVVNTRDYNSRETPLHIVVKRNDEVYTKFLLQKGADPNLRDKDGNTPLMVAINLGNAELVPLLLAGRANVNLGNNGGETPLIRAVQRRDLEVVRTLLAAGADADQVDSLAGKSARIYAQEDTRTPALGKVFADVPKRDRRAVSGPKL